MDKINKLQGFNQASLARELKRSKVWINRVATGKENASIDLAFDIQKITGGKVKAVDLLSEKDKESLAKVNTAPSRSDLADVA